jgi:hypothetical protein
MNLFGELEYYNISTELNFEINTYESTLVQQAVLLDFMETYCVADIIITQRNEVE